MENQILQGDALTKLKELPNESINCVMTSPPYWALRDYSDETEVIWDGDENCEHEWVVEVTHRPNSGGGEGEKSKIQTGNKGSYWNRPSREEYENREVDLVCSVCKKQFIGKPNQKFCSKECLNTLSNFERQSRTQISNFCQKCNAWKGQLGLEPTFDLYISHLCDIFDEVKRVLRKDGTCWINLGDSYSGGNLSVGQPKDWKSLSTLNKEKKYDSPKFNELIKNRNKLNPLQSKSLCNIPARFSIEMQNRGWILRNVIIWHKNNVMPSSVKDRFTVDFEYLYFFVKNKKYFFETQYENYAESTINDDRFRKAEMGGYDGGSNIKEGYEKSMQQNPKEIRNSVFNKGLQQGRNKRTVWNINTKPFKEAHFAVYPEELCYTPIKAGCPEFICNKCGKAREPIYKSQFKQHSVGATSGQYWEVRNFKGSNTVVNSTIQTGLTNCNCNAGFSSGIVLDPFFGAGTTGLVALKQNKKFIGIELNSDYCKIANNRLKPYLEQTKL